MIITQSLYFTLGFTLNLLHSVDFDRCYLIDITDIYPSL